MDQGGKPEVAIQHRPSDGDIKAVNVCGVSVRGRPARVSLSHFGLPKKVTRVFFWLHHGESQGAYECVPTCVWELCRDRVAITQSAYAHSYASIKCRVQGRDNAVH